MKRIFIQSLLLVVGLGASMVGWESEQPAQSSIR